MIILSSEGERSANNAQSSDTSRNVSDADSLTAFSYSLQHAELLSNDLDTVNMREAGLLVYPLILGYLVISIALLVSCKRTSFEAPLDQREERQAAIEVSWFSDAEDPTLNEKLNQLISVALASPHDASVIAELAMTYDANGLGDSATLAYKRAIELAPETFEWWYLLALRVKKNGELERAIDLAQQATALDPEYAAIHMRLGNWLLDFGDILLATDSFHRAGELGIGPSAELGLSRTRLKRGEHADAIHRLSNLVQKTAHPVAIRLLAESWIAIGEESKARELLRDLPNQRREMWFADPIADQIQNFSVGSRRGIQGIQQMLADGFVEDALQAAKLLESQFEQNFNIQYHLGLAYIAQQNHDQAFPHLLKTVELEPLHYPAHLLLAANYQHRGDNESAERHLVNVATIYPNLSIAHQELGFVRLQMDDHEGALRSFKDAIRLDSVEPQVHYLAGAILGSIDQCREALIHFENALLLDSSHTKAQQGINLCSSSLSQRSRQ